MVQYSLGQHFVTELFGFHEIKPLMPILALLPFLCISKKLYCVHSYRSRAKIRIIKLEHMALIF